MSPKRREAVLVKVLGCVPFPVTGKIAQPRRISGSICPVESSRVPSTRKTEVNAVPTSYFHKGSNPHEGGWVGACGVSHRSALNDSRRAIRVAISVPIA